MPRTATLENVRVGRDGSLLLCVAKQVTHGKQVHSSEPHLHRLEPGESVGDALARLDDWLVLNGWPKLGKTDCDFVEALHAAVEASR